MSTKIEAAKSALTRITGRGSLQLGKHSPTIMFGIGIVGVIGTAVLASRATLRLEEVLEETTELRTRAKDILHSEGHNYTQEHFDSDMRKIQARQLVAVLKLYAPTVVCGVVSIALLTGSHVTLTRRNTSLMAAYAALDSGFKKYRSRVTEELGADKDREFFHGVETTETITVNKNGKEKTQIEKFAADVSPYGRIYDEQNQMYVHGSPEQNLAQMRLWQNALNSKLSSQGHLFLNEAYDLMGYERTKAGAVVGWIYEGGEGDGQVDFGIWDDENLESLLSFMSRVTGELIVDFNVDGVIYDKI